VAEGVDRRLHSESIPALAFASRGRDEIVRDICERALSRNRAAAYGFNPSVRAHDASDPGPKPRRIAHTYRIDRIEFRFDRRTHAGAYSNSSAAQGLTLRERAWFSAAMTQRSIPQSLPTTAPRRAATAHAQAARIDITVLNAALVAVVLVVVLITTTTGAG
jgi:hypothetical protein